MFLRDKSIIGLFDNIVQVDMDVQRTALDAEEKLYLVYCRNQYVNKAIADKVSYLNFADAGTVDQGKDCSICFDGHWEPNSSGLYKFITDEKPWIFWLTLDNKLMARMWDSGSIIEIDTDVTSFDSVRGWKDAVAADSDQGLILAYVKGGMPYYRNLVDTAWSIAYELDQLPTTCVSISAYRTNDYRVVILVEDASSMIHWTITHRNWAGMAVPAERLTAKVVASISTQEIMYYDVIEVEHLIATVDGSVNMCLPIIVSFISASNVKDVAYVFTVVASHPILGDIDQTMFAVKDGANTVFPIVNIIRNGVALEFTISTSMAAAQGNLTITYTGTTLYSMGDACKFYYSNPTTVSFDPDITPPAGYEIDKLKATVVGTINPVAVSHSYTQNNESLKAIVVATIVPTKVNDNPV